jgi:hypothetical protein
MIKLDTILKENDANYEWGVRLLYRMWNNVGMLVKNAVTEQWDTE